MTPRALPLIRRLVRCGALGFACGGVIGALFVLIGWFPSALARHGDDPTFLAQSLLAWCAAWAVVCGAVGLVVGVIVSVLIDVGDRLPDGPPAPIDPRRPLRRDRAPRHPPAGMPPR